MTHRHSRRLVLAVLNRLVRDQALAGDLLEASRDRSAAWLWRQVMGALVSQGCGQWRAHPRALAEQLLVGTALVALLGFCGLVAATLANRILVLSEQPWAAGGPLYTAGQAAVTPALFAVALFLGHAIARVRRSHRIAAVLACGASVSAAAFLNLIAFVPPAVRQPFVPDGAVQIALAAVFVAGLWLGSKWSTTCEPLRVS